VNLFFVRLLSFQTFSLLKVYKISFDKAKFESIVKQKRLILRSTLFYEIFHKGD